MSASEKSQFQTVLDLSVIWTLRVLQAVALIAMIAICIMGFAEIARSVREFVHYYEVSFPAAEEAHKENKPSADHPASTPPPGEQKVATPASNDAAVNSEAPPAPVAVGPENGAPKVKGHHRKKEEGEDDPIHVAFQGLEFLLLAPLFFLMLRSLTEYVADLNLKERENLKRTSKRSGDSAKPEDRDEDAAIATLEIGLGKETLLETKALSLGLLFAIVATHLVGRLISGAYSLSHEAALSGDRSNWNEIVAGLLLLFLIAAVYFGIELLAHKIKRDCMSSREKATLGR